MKNRQRDDYNDVGWDILPSNYSRFITQIDPEETSLGWWHIGPRESIYSRFARSTDVENGNNTLYFDLDDAFLLQDRPVEVRIVWLDQGKSEWKLNYNSLGDPEKTALLVKNTDTGKWKEKKQPVDEPFWFGEKYTGHCRRLVEEFYGLEDFPAAVAAEYRRHRFCHPDVPVIINSRKRDFS